MMNCDQLRAVRKSAFDLHFSNHGWNTGHDLMAAEKLTAEVHQLRHSAAIANKFQKLRRNQSDGLGMVQPQAAREAFLGEETRVVKEQFVNFARREVHGG